MMVLERDYNAARAISLGVDVEGYGKIYYKTNEDSLSALRNLAIYDKNILTVLGSSDQIHTFNFLSQGDRVDSFDTNILALYYYYYRRWSILYGEHMYPEELVNNERFTIGSILDKVKPETEEEKTALDFWKRHVNNKTNLDELFYYADCEGNTIFEEREDLLSTVRKNPNFHHIDLFRPVSLDKKYDIVYLSNIIEWSRNNSDKLLTIRDNLDRLVTDGGIVICTNVIHRARGSVQNERTIFGEKFEVEKEDLYSYRYVKKK